MCTEALSSASSTVLRVARTSYHLCHRYTDTCYQDLSKKHTNVTLTIGGDLSTDPDSPGLLHEAFVLDNHTVTAKNPNMLFNVSRDANGQVNLPSLG